MNGTRTRIKGPTPDVCTLDDCAEPYLAKGFCESHYRRFKRHGDPLAGRIRRRRDEFRECDIDDCDEPHRANGVCNRHLLRRGRWGDAEWGYRSVDEIAVERAVMGERAGRMTTAEREEAVRLLHRRRFGDRRIARRLGISPSGVRLIRQRLGLPALSRPARTRATFEPRLFLPHPWISENVARQRNRARLELRIQEAA